MCPAACPASSGPRRRRAQIANMRSSVRHIPLAARTPDADRTMACVSPSSPNPSRPRSTALPTACCGRPSTSYGAATNHSSSLRPPRAARTARRTRSDRTVPHCPSSGSPLSPFPATPRCGSRCPAGSSPPPSPATGPTWCTSPARSSSARAGWRWRRRSDCRPSPSTRPTWPATRRRTGSGAGSARRPPGTGSARCTAPRTAPWRRPPPPPRTSPRTACPGCSCGRAASTPSASIPGTGTRRCTVRWRPAGRCWSAMSGGWRRRSGSTCWPGRPRCPASGWW